MATQKEQEISAPFRPRRLGHVNYFVSDIDRTMDFYKKVGGLEEVYRKAGGTTPDAPVVAGFLSNGNTHHDVAVGNRGSKPGLNHFGFEVENETDLVAGFRATPAEITFRASDHRIARSLYSFDPDGNGTELYADITPEWRKVRGDGRIVRDNEPPWTPGDPPRFTEADAHNYHVNPEIRRVKEAIFHAKRVTHGVVVAEDYEGLYEYYTSLVGLQPILGGRKDRFVVLGGTTGEPQLTLFRAKEGQPTGMHHFGFEVWDEEDLQVSEGKLKEAGIEPVFILDHSTRRSVFIKDPDGLLVEFYVDRAPAGSSLSEVEEELSLFLA